MSLFLKLSSMKIEENWGKLEKIGENWRVEFCEFCEFFEFGAILGNFGQFWSIFRYLFQNLIRQNSFNSNSDIWGIQIRNIKKLLWRNTTFFPIDPFTMEGRMVELSSCPIIIRSFATTAAASRAGRGCPPGQPSTVVWVAKVFFGKSECSSAIRGEG